MKKPLYLFSVLLLLFPALLRAQDTLPRFSLKNAGNNRIIIGWNNPYADIRQISIQRSTDSLAGYKTILTVPDPTPPQNGFVDTKAPNDRMFYRIYIMRDKGVFLFSDARRPVKDSIALAKITGTIPPPDTIQVGDSFIVAKPIGIKLDKFPGTDSVAVPNVPNRPKPNAFTPSLYVYTNRDGYVRISLPEDRLKKYSIKFFEDNGDFLFELPDVKERDFKIDKSNFYHAGWFRFELYENGKLMEKHKFLLDKDF